MGYKFFTHVRGLMNLQVAKMSRQSDRIRPFSIDEKDRVSADGRVEMTVSCAGIVSQAQMWRRKR